MQGSLEPPADFRAGALRSSRRRITTSYSVNEGVERGVAGVTRTAPSGMTRDDTRTPDADDFPVLLEAARQGDPEAIADLLDRCQTRLGNVTGPRLGEALRARVRSSDITQEVSLEVLQRLWTFDGETESQFFAWVNTILDSRIKKAVRHFAAKKRKHPSQTSSKEAMKLHFLANRRSIASELGDEEQAERIRIAIDGLKPDFRDVLRMVFIEGLSRGEVAERLGRTDGATRMLLSRARAELAVVLGLGVDESPGDAPDPRTTNDSA